MLRATATLDQLRELSAVGWLDAVDAQQLVQTAKALRQQRMMISLTGTVDAAEAPVDCSRSRALFEALFGAVNNGN